MTTTTTPPPPSPSGPAAADGAEAPGGWLRSILISLLVLGAAVGGAAVVLTTEPTAERVEATRKTAMLVETVTVARGTWRPLVVATGTVRPAREVVLRSQVEGRVAAIAAELTPGGFVAEGEALVRIEAADYENALTQRRSALRQARADLAVEEGRRNVAREEYALLGERLPPDREALVLRHPQRDAARARVAAARAAVDQAALDLERTTVEAPFAAHVLRRDVNVGSRVSPDDPLARLVGLDTWWVVVDLPLDRLRLVSVPDGSDAPGSRVTVRDRAAWPEGARRSGHLYRLIGALDDRTRMARVLATIPDPLGRRTGAGPALLIGEFVEVRIRGDALSDVVRLDRDHLREDDTVWLMEDGRLRIRAVDVVARDAEHAYVAAGLEDGDRVVTTDLATVTDGARLREAPAAGGMAPHTSGDAAAGPGPDTSGDGPPPVSGDTSSDGAREAGDGEDTP